MKSRERVLATLRREKVDRVPRFEIWIDALLDELGQGDPYDAYANFGQDCVMMPGRRPLESNAWSDGVDEWGCIWGDGMYRGGMVDSDDDLRKYSTPPDYAEEHFDVQKIKEVWNRYPDHCHIYGTHIGPFTAGYMAMGFERFFMRLFDDRAYIHKLLEDRTNWCIAMYQKAIILGAEVVVLGDDAASGSGPMVSPKMWREIMLPYHQRIVDELDVPVIWHSDGNIEPLLPMAVEAGFVGVHGLEPSAGMDLSAVKRDFGDDLVLVGNIDVGALCNSDIDAVRREVDRCMEQGAPGGGYMMATSNSVFTGMNLVAVTEMFRYQSEIG
jgi:uroporphyrinogen decarboxylase